MKNLFLSVFICLSALTTNAATYYFSFSSGDDSRTSAQPRTRLRHGSHLQCLMSVTKHGTRRFCFTEKGDMFSGNIVITKAGTESAPITIGAYGIGDNPVIDGFAAVSGWTYLGNGIYESKELPTGSTVNMVTINGVEYAMGKLPDADASNAGYRIFESTHQIVLQIMMLHMILVG